MTPLRFFIYVSIIPMIGLFVAVFACSTIAADCLAGLPNEAVAESKIHELQTGIRANFVTTLIVTTFGVLVTEYGLINAFHRKRWFPQGEED